MRRSVPLIAGLALFCVSAQLLPPAFARQAPAKPIDYTRDIAPILGTRCTSCHAGDDPSGGLRLEKREDLLAGGESGEPAIVPGKPDESPLIRLVSGADPLLVMPPKGKRLTPEQVKLLRDWIAQGAPWADPNADTHWHWSYQPVVRPAPPPVRAPELCRNPIDNFVNARLEAEGLQPAPEADRPTLIRRLSLDLIGLPPSIAEVDAFVQDTRPDAYERLVDRLLASPHYGERFARPWLDLARYADTHGYEKDNRRVMWPYRDWVIDALNADLPFDQFTTDQLAGDLVDKPARSQIIATGFNRNTMINEEGGVDPEEFRAEAIIDRVNTVGSVWLGSTVGCAQCHDHKYDPIKHKDYYQLFAIFNQDAPDTVPHKFGSDAAGPMIEVPKREFESEFDSIIAERVRLRTLLGTQTPSLDEAQLAWERAIVKAAGQWSPLEPRSAVAASSTASIQPDRAISLSGANPETDSVSLEYQTDLASISALRIDILPDESTESKGVGRAIGGNFVLSDIKLSLIRAESSPAEDLSFVSATQDFNQSGGKGPTEWAASAAIDADTLKTGWAVAPRTGEPHAAVFRLSEAREIPPGARLRVVLQFGWGMQHVASRFRLSAKSEADTEPPVSPAIVAIAATAADARSAEQKSRIAQVHRELTPLLDGARKELAAADSRYSQALAARVMVMGKSDAPRETHIFERGSFLSPGPKVEPNVPHFLPQISDKSPVNRLTFARWLVGPDNPLTSRVTANRAWEHIFGRGIVETSEDFGTQGEAPTHPELLDYLASELMASGWRMKSLHKLIVTSATYRRSSSVSPSLLEKDPYNKLLARAPRFRVEAEMIRDIALTASGLLSRKLGGPSVFPPQPEGTWTMIYNSDRWTESKGEDRYRRGLYTFWRRTAPYPTFTTFDAPSREIACARRPRTNTPLQALTTLNDPQFIEAAAALARLTLDEGGDTTPAKLTYAFRRCLARPPAPAELDRLTSLLEQSKSMFEADPAASAALSGSGTPGQGGAYSQAETAAWTVLANVLLNLDETLSRS